jgi:hypothetical protein
MSDTLPPRLYHGTSDGYLDQILRDGLDPQSSRDGYLCYTDDPETARYHALHMAEWDSEVLDRTCRPVTITIPFDRFAIEGFCLDRNFIRLGPSHGRAVGRRLGGRRWTWETLLRETGAVGYRLRLIVGRDDVTRLRPAKRDDRLLTG